MPNFFICVLLPRVVPPNQYTIHKYPRAPCSRQSGDESLRVSLLHTSWLPEEGKNNFQAIVQFVLRKAGFSLKSLVLCILLSWIQWSRISYFNKKKKQNCFWTLCWNWGHVAHEDDTYFFLILWTAFKNNWVKMLASMWNHWKRCSTDARPCVALWGCSHGATSWNQREFYRFTVQLDASAATRPRGVKLNFRTGLLTLIWKGINAPCDITMGYI